MKQRFIGWRSTERQKENGSFTVEAACALLGFILAIGLIYSLVQAVLAQRAVQLALDRTALEISEYCYPAAAVGDALADGLNQKAEEKEKNGEKTSLLLKAAQGLLSLSRGSDSDVYSASEVTENLYRQILSGAVSGDAASLTDIFRGALSAYGDTPQKAVAAMAAGIGKYEVSGLLAHAVAVPLCEMMVPDNLPTDDADAYLKRLGVVDGTSGLDYSLSRVLPDGNEILLCAVYEIQVCGDVFPWKIKVVQTASTGSWCTAGTKAASSVWKLGNFARGKKLVSLAKEASPGQGVKAGLGFDLYDTGTNTVTSVVSVNLFTSAYSQRKSGTDAGSGDASEYSLTAKKVKSSLKSSVNALQKGVNKRKNGESIAMQNGGETAFRKEGLSLCLRVIIPEEASVFDAELREIAAAVEKDTGVSIVFERKDKALE